MQRTAPVFTPAQMTSLEFTLAQQNAPELTFTQRTVPEFTPARGTFPDFTIAYRNSPAFTLAQRTMLTLTIAYPTTPPTWTAFALATLVTVRLAVLVLSSRHRPRGVSELQGFEIFTVLLILNGTQVLFPTQLLLQ